MERDVQWKPLPEDLEERLALQGRGEPFVEIQIAICEPGERKVRLGEMESVGAKARREGEVAILFVSSKYAELGGSPSADECAAALLVRLAQLDWGVVVKQEVIDVPVSDVPVS